MGEEKKEGEEKEGEGRRSRGGNWIRSQAFGPISYWRPPRVNLTTKGRVTTTPIAMRRLRTLIPMRKASWSIDRDRPLPT